MTYEEALKKIERLAETLDKNGFTSILILKARGCRNKTHMSVTFPEHHKQILGEVLNEARGIIRNDQT